MTVSEIIKKLGGTTAAAAVFGVTPPAVSNWKAENRFPPRVHWRVVQEMRQLGVEVDPEKLEAA